MVYIPVYDEILLRFVCSFCALSRLALNLFIVSRHATPCLDKSVRPQADFIRDYLGPVLREDHPDVKIMAFDHNRDHRESESLIRLRWERK